MRFQGGGPNVDGSGCRFHFKEAATSTNTAKILLPGRLKRSSNCYHIICGVIQSICTNWVAPFQMRVVGRTIVLSVLYSALGKPYQYYLTWIEYFKGGRGVLVINLGASWHCFGWSRFCVSVSHHRMAIALRNGKIVLKKHISRLSKNEDIRNLKDLKTTISAN